MGRTTDKVAMTRRTVVAGAALMVAVLPLAACSELFPSSYRFRMIVEVETPQGLRTGSGVMEISAGRIPGILQWGDVGSERHQFRGEAVAVDLPDGQTLFALLSDTAGLKNVVTSALHPRYGKPDTLVQSVKAINRRDQTGRTAVLPRRLPGEWYGADGPPSAYPLLVRFRNIADPASVEAVDPDDLAASFGPGYRLRRITVQITDDPVTTGIEKRLGWLRTVSKKDFPPRFQPPGIPVGDFKGLFSTEVSR